jgi:HAD superfamily hydrolase (TIGR01509 family)
VSRRGVLFDVDGTLVDTNLLHILAWQRSFRDHGLTVPAYKLQHLVGMGADKLLDALFGEHRQDLDDGYAKHFGTFREEIVPIDGAADLLRAVHDRGGVVVLATSSKPEDAARLKAALDVDRAIDVMVTGGDVKESKPAGDIFRAALAKGGLLAAGAVVVGDTVWDVKAASECGLRTIAVRSGGVPDEALRTAGAVAIYDDAADLLAKIDDSPIAELLGGANPA